MDKVMVLPQQLPAPVTRFYQTLFGDEIPLISEASVSGRAAMHLFGLTLPVKMRIEHVAGRDYRHHFEIALGPFSLLRMNEQFVDGRARLELPFGVVENDPRVDQGANLALWAETLFWLPSVLITDARVKWVAIDSESAGLVVPFANTNDSLVVRFDADTALPCMAEAMRFKAGKQEKKILWVCEAAKWGYATGQRVATEAALTWLDDGKPWARFWVDSVLYR